MEKKQLEIDEVKNIANNILLWLRDVCRQHNIKYLLSYGTLLGAVRHNGFIPWDDDVDIWMDRDNYIKFSNVVKNSNSYYKLLYIDTDKKYSLPLPKLVDTRTVAKIVKQKEKCELGVWVDIFIVDSVPADKNEREEYYKRLARLQWWWSFVQYKYCWKGSPMKFLKFLFHETLYYVIGPRRFAIAIDKLALKYYNKNTDYCAILTFVISDRERDTIKKEVLSNVIELEFEGEKHLVPGEYDYFLKKWYRDYMKLPPLNKQVSNHRIVSYWK